MGSNFSAIGVHDDVEEFIERALEDGGPVQAGKGMTYRWFGGGLREEAKTSFMQRLLGR